MRLSKYVHSIENNGYYILYNAATTKIILQTKNQYFSLLEGIDLDIVFKPEQIELLSHTGCLHDENEFDLKQCINNNGHDKVDVFALYLILTEQCNMNCLYCSQSAYRIRNRMPNMSLETVETVLEKFYQTDTKRKRTIVLYGGEPTLNPYGIKSAINYVRNRQHDNDAEIVIFTNGILLNDKIIRFLKDRNVDVIISIDGQQEINDLYRLVCAEGSYHKIIEATERLQYHNIPFGTSTTIAAHNVDELEDVVRFLYEKFTPVSVGLNPFHYAPESRNQMAVHEEKMAIKMLDAYDVARSYGLYVEQIMRRVRPFVLSTPRFKDCPSCGGMVRALPDGSFGPCGHFMEEKQERERSDYTFEESSIMKKWNARINADAIKKCETCIAMALCGGGCPFNSLKHGGDIFSANDDRSCVQAKVFLEWLIKETVTGLPMDAFYNVSMAEKEKIFGNINLEQRVPMSSYSKYGEFILDERYM